jgi:hypothetical protein
MGISMGSEMGSPIRIAPPSGSILHKPGEPASADYSALIVPDKIIWDVDVVAPYPSGQQRHSHRPGHQIDGARVWLR